MPVLYIKGLPAIGRELDMTARTLQRRIKAGNAPPMTQGDNGFWNADPAKLQKWHREHILGIKGDPA